MTKVSRREFLSRAAIVLGAAPLLSAAGCASTPTPAPAKAPDKPAAAPESSQAAPVVIKGTSLNVMAPTMFIRDSEILFKEQALQWGKENGVTMNMDFLNWTDIQPKIAAAIQAGGFDVVGLLSGWNGLYARHLVDMTPEAEALAKAQGGFTEIATDSIKGLNAYLGLPYGSGAPPCITYRISMLKEAGLDIPPLDVQKKENKYPQLTFEQYHALGKKLKAMGKPLGQSLAHARGDLNNWCYCFMWSYGAMEIDENGKVTKFNTPQFVDGMKQWIQWWKDCYDETGLSWDDSANNRAVTAGTISATQNGPTVYWQALKDNPEAAKDISHMHPPEGPAGRFYIMGTQYNGILKNSKNIPAAKEYLKWWHSEKPFGDWLRVQVGFHVPVTKKWFGDPTVWGDDPKLGYVQYIDKYKVRYKGYAGPINEQSSMAEAKWIVGDTFYKAVTTGDAVGSIKWGETELKKIYEA